MEKTYVADIKNEKLPIAVFPNPYVFGDYERHKDAAQQGNPCARNAVIKFWKNNDLFFMVHPYSVDMILIHCINLILFHGSLHLLTMGYVSQ